MAECFHCIVAPAHSFADAGLLTEKLDPLLRAHMPDVEIITFGEAERYDVVANYALQRNFAVRGFEKDDMRHGRAAGYVRDQEMFEYAALFPDDNGCVLLFDGKDPEIRQCMRLAKRIGVPCRTIPV